MLAASVVAIAALVAPIGTKVIAGDEDNAIMQVLKQHTASTRRERQAVREEIVYIEQRTPRTARQQRALQANAYAAQPQQRGLLQQLFGQEAMPQQFLDVPEAAAPAAKPKKRATKPARTPAVAAGPITGRTYCVRLCDGYFFPVGYTRGKDDLDEHETMCAATCPSSPTRLYIAPPNTESIEGAISADGKPYTSLATAFLHRETTSGPKCGCRTAGQTALDLVAITKDFTLRRGDAVVTADGVKIFDGTQRWPYKATAFRDLKRSKAIAGNERRLLGAIKVALGDDAADDVIATPAPKKPDVAAPAKTNKKKKKKKVAGKAARKAPAKVEVAVLERKAGQIRQVGPDALIVR